MCYVYSLCLSFIWTGVITAIILNNKYGKGFNPETSELQAHFNGAGILSAGITVGLSNLFWYLSFF